MVLKGGTPTSTLASTQSTAKSTNTEHDDNVMSDDQTIYNDALEEMELEDDVDDNEKTNNRSQSTA